MKDRRLTLCLLLSLLLLLAACRATAAPQSERHPTDEPTVTASSEVPTEEPAATDTVAPPTASLEAPIVDSNKHPFASPEYAMQAFMWWRPEVADRDLNLIVDAGFNWVKQDFAWREIEGAGKGIFDWQRPDTIVQMTYDRFGVNIIARVDRQPAWATDGKCADAEKMGPPNNYLDYADFLTALASRYKGKIGAYAIWNEPNLAREWCDEPPNPEEYAKLLKIAYSAIKSADPDAIVISAGLSPTGGPMPIAMEDTEYLRKLYEIGGGSLDGYTDVVGAHAPGFRAPPETSPDEVMANTEFFGNGRYFTFRRIEDLRAIMEEYNDSERQMAILEMGWTTDSREESPYNWHAVTQEQKADYLVRAFAYAEQHWSPWIGVMTVIYLCNTDWTDDNEQYYWCITHPDYPNTITYPAYEALKTMPKNFD